MTTSTVPKLLFLHGFLQNGKVFSEKSSGIRKLLKKLNVQCDYIDGPTVLQRTDLPFQMDDDKWEQCVETNTNRAWFYHSEISHELDLSVAIKYVADHIKENGPYDGIVGFSQGAAVASIITNKITNLVPQHPEFKLSLLISGYSFTEPNPANTQQLRITDKFVDAFTPQVGTNTKILFIYGTSDQAVPAVRSKYLYDIYERAQCNVKAFEHPGGHMVPNKKDIIRPVVEEIGSALGIPSSNTN